MNPDLQVVVVRLREILQLLDDQGHPWAALHVNDAIEELAPSPAILSPCDDIIH